MPIIYRITNNITHKSYIGQTKYTLEKRWAQHRNTKESSKFYDAMRNYDISCWQLEILEEIADNDVSEREIYWISFFDSMKYGYNSNSGGVRPSEISDETRKKISKIHLGKILSPQHRERLTKSRIGKHNAPAHNDKIAKSRLGKHHSDETKNKMAKTKKGKINSVEHRNKISESMKKFHKKKLLLIES